MKEITPPEGYLVDEEEHDVICNDEGDLVAEVSRSITSKEQVYKQPFQVIKVSDNGTDTEADLLEGAGFSAYLKSSLSVKQDGSYDFDQATPIVIGKNGETTLYTDSNGYLVTIPIPYGTYIVAETVTPHNMKTITPFEVTINEHKPTQPQTWRIFLDREFTAKLKIVKKDSKTGQSVLVPKAEFKIFDMDKEEDGKATISDLPLGSYYVVEVEAPYGYVLSKEDQIVALEYEDDKTPVVYETVTFSNKRQKAALSIYKFDSETERPIAGAEFALYAKDDIKNVNGEVIVKADTLLETAVSDTGGNVFFTKDLPFGTYYAKELQTPAGYVSNDEIVEFEFEYEGQDKERIEVKEEFENEPTKVEFIKKDITSGVQLSGATLSVLKQDGTMVETWTSDADEPHVMERLVVGETYILREEYAPYGYLKAEEIMFTVGDTNEMQTVEMKDEVPIGTIMLNKDGQYLTGTNLIKGQWYDVSFQYSKESLAGVPLRYMPQRWKI